MTTLDWIPNKNPKKHYGKKVCIYYKNSINALPLQGIFVDLYDTYPMLLTIKLYTPEKTNYGLIRKFNHIRNNEIYKVIVDDSNYLHNKYVYCRSALISILPEEIVKKNIFSFLIHHFIEM
jgi:hypothetical protein